MFKVLILFLCYSFICHIYRTNLLLLTFLRADRHPRKEETEPNPTFWIGVVKHIQECLNLGKIPEEPLGDLINLNCFENSLR